VVEEGETVGLQPDCIEEGVVRERGKGGAVEGLQGQFRRSGRQINGYLVEVELPCRNVHQYSIAEVLQMRALHPLCDLYTLHQVSLPEHEYLLS
jgi:hypothetical protein